MNQVATIVLALALATAAHGAGEETSICGPKLRNKDVTVYEVPAFRTSTWAERLVLEEHGASVTVVLTEEIQAQRNLVKEARRRSAKKGCPYVIVAPSREVVTSVHFEPGRVGGATLPVERTVRRGQVAYGDMRVGVE